MGVVSMTGFGRGESAANGLRAVVEMSSVNRKQFDCQTTLPRSLAGFDARVQTAVKTAVCRGHVKTVITLVAEAASADAACIDLAKWGARVAAVRAAAMALGLPDDLSASSLLNSSDCVAATERTISADEAWAVIEPALGRALDQLVEMRRREGDAIRADICARFAGLRGVAAEIAARAPEIPRQYRDTLRIRINDLLAIQGQLIDEQILAREVALFADRCDISEELNRLASHFDQADGFLAGSEPCGRTLDFLCQEIFREINTVGSKANDAAITRAVIAFKTSLEAVREQVQNIE
ncbi:MAG: YicC family protein [Lentisphaerae bacterium]|nr:YicC family protein [Lentisphaerota bacterium]